MTTSVLTGRGTVRDGFFPSLGARTWRPRAFVAAALADLGAVESPAAYAAWLGRATRAWSHLPLAPIHGDCPWPLLAVGPECLDGRAALEADLSDLAFLGASAGRGARLPRQRFHAVAEADEAFLVGAAYVATVIAADAAVLTDAALALAARERWAPIGTRFLERCRDSAPSQPLLRHELARWAGARGPEAAERAVLTAHTLLVELAQALQEARTVR
jgi:hypothetical protein